MIPSLNYYTDSAFNEEMDTLFKQCWIFVGLKLELQGLSHAGKQVGKHNLVIQLDAEGNARAFRNVCSHRSSRLCKPGVHSGAIRCPYHGWVYDRTGKPINIPIKQSFPQVVENPESYKLQEFSCETVGQFIFVRLSDEGLDLRQYLGNEYDFLLKISHSMNKCEDSFNVGVQANWKVVIENSLEGYHVPAVHSKTFLVADGMGKSETAPVFNVSDPLHSHLIHDADQAWVKRFSRIERQIGKWPWRFENYTHHHIFPNLTVTSFMGYSVHVQLFHPLAADQTEVYSQTIGVKFEEASPAGAKMIEKIYQDGHSFTRKIFAEDGEICQEIQAGIKQAFKLPVFGLGLEERVQHFHQAYSSIFK